MSLCLDDLDHELRYLVVAMIRQATLRRKLARWHMLPERSTARVDSAGGNPDECWTVKIPKRKPFAFYGSVSTPSGRVKLAVCWIPSVELDGTVCAVPMDQDGGTPRPFPVDLSTLTVGTLPEALEPYLAEADARKLRMVVHYGRASRVAAFRETIRTLLEKL